MIKILKETIIFGAILLTITPPVLANSGPVYWQGYPSFEIIAVEENSPIQVEKEDLLFDFSESDHSFYALSGKVTAAYTMKNPTKERQLVTMAFPFIGSLDDLLSKEILIKADGRELPYEVYFGETVDSQGSPWQKKDGQENDDQENDRGKFDFASILANIRTEPYRAENFTDDTKGKLYSIEVVATSNQRISLAIDLEYDPAKTKVLSKGFNSYSYLENSNKRTIGTWCDQQPRNVELYVLGEDIEFEMNGYVGNDNQVRNDLFNKEIKVTEAELKPYLMEYVNKNIHVQSGSPIFDNQSYSDQLFYLYGQALDQALMSGNIGYSTEDDLMSLGNARRMITLVYTVEFPPKSTQEVNVSYQATGTMDRTKTVNPLYRFDYLLNPAENWQDFNNLNIKIITPRGTPYVVESSIELAREEERVYMASLAELPGEDFSFTLYETEKVTLLDKARGNLNSVFGYFTPLVIGLAALLGITGLIAGVRRFKKLDT